MRAKDIDVTVRRDVILLYCLAKAKMDAPHRILSCAKNYAKGLGIEIKIDDLKSVLDSQVREVLGL